MSPGHHVHQLLPGPSSWADEQCIWTEGLRCAARARLGRRRYREHATRQCCLSTTGSRTIGRIDGISVTRTERSADVPQQLEESKETILSIYASSASCVRGRIYHQPRRCAHAPLPAGRVTIQGISRLLPLLRFPLPARSLHLTLLDALVPDPPPLLAFSPPSGQPRSPHASRNVLLHPIRIPRLRHHLLGGLARRRRLRELFRRDSRECSGRG